MTHKKVFISEMRRAIIHLAMPHINQELIIFLHGAPISVELLHARVEDIGLHAELHLYIDVGDNPQPDSLVLDLRNIFVSLSGLDSHRKESAHH